METQWVECLALDFWVGQLNLVCCSYSILWAFVEAVHNVLSESIRQCSKIFQMVGRGDGPVYFPLKYVVWAFCHGWVTFRSFAFLHYSCHLHILWHVNTSQYLCPMDEAQAWMGVSSVLKDIASALVRVKAVIMYYVEKHVGVLVSFLSNVISTDPSSIVFITRFWGRLYHCLWLAKHLIISDPCIWEVLDKFLRWNLSWNMSASGHLIGVDRDHQGLRLMGWLDREHDHVNGTPSGSGGLNH